MANVTNVIEIFRASKSTGDSLYGRVKGAQGALIEHLYLKHDADYDYLLFDFSSATIEPKFTSKYSALDSKTDTNPASGEIALHIRIPSQFRRKLENFYDELCLSYDPSETDETVWSVIDEWAMLFERAKLDKLSREDEIGLFGELLVLKQLYQNGHQHAVNYWFGPAGRLHDFEKENHWNIEVKTSLSPNPTVYVSKIEQLEPLENPFHLVIVKLKSDKSGITLPSLIAELRHMVRDVPDKERFQELLDEIGYTEAMKSLYTRKFTLLGIEKYKIDENTRTLCPLNISESAKYKSASWVLIASDYPMENCDDNFWANPV
jgi:hypothetical protein